jgi:hypothetical protein
MTYILRTIDRQGDWTELKRYSCIIRACSTAELYSDKNLHRNVVVTNTRDRKSLGFVNGAARVT